MKTFKKLTVRHHGLIHIATCNRLPNAWYNILPIQTQDLNFLIMHDGFINPIHSFAYCPWLNTRGSPFSPSDIYMYPERGRKTERDEGEFRSRLRPTCLYPSGCMLMETDRETTKTITVVSDLCLAIRWGALFPSPASLCLSLSLSYVSSLSLLSPHLCTYAFVMISPGKKTLSLSLSLRINLPMYYVIPLHIS